MGDGRFPDRMVRQIFFEREGAACFLCRRGLMWHERGYGWSLHHRKPRGMGGTKTVMTPAAGLVLCGSGTTGCHGWAENVRAKAIEIGVLISRHGVGQAFDPANVRVQRNDGTWWLLTESGRAVEVESKTWA